MSDAFTIRELKAAKTRERQHALQARFDPHHIKAQRDEAIEILRKLLRWYARPTRDMARLEADGIEPARELLNTE